MISFSFNDRSLIDTDPTISNKTTVIFKYPCKTLYSCSSYSITLEIGKYLLEAWGAAGSSGTGSNSGSGAAVVDAWRTGGGYSSGILDVKSKLSFYLFIGSAPEHGVKSGGFNGGGTNTEPHEKSSGSGGGATDFRVVYHSSWSDNDSLMSRFLVAGGSGGGHEPLYGRGGYGGGEVAWSSLNEGNTIASYSTFFGSGGTQENGGSGSTSCSSCTSGTFGEGGTGYDGGGGGGGWYGGGGGYYGIGGGGGSGFAFHSKTQNFQLVTMSKIASCFRSIEYLLAMKHSRRIKEDIKQEISEMALQE